MTYEWILIACGIATMSGGLIAGVFLTFSDFVMKSLAAANPVAGIEAMQQINRKVYSSTFLVLLLGLTGLCIILGSFAYFRMTGTAATWIMLGSVLYVSGVFVVTVLFNVPMNKRLDTMKSDGADAASYWSRYLLSWTRWNHLRTGASAAAAACFMIGAFNLN